MQKYNEFDKEYELFESQHPNKTVEDDDIFENKFEIIQQEIEKQLNEIVDEYDTLYFQITTYPQKINRKQGLIKQIEDVKRGITDLNNMIKFNNSSERAIKDRKNLLSVGYDEILLMMLFGPLLDADFEIKRSLRLIYQRNVSSILDFIVPITEYSDGTPSNIPLITVGYDEIYKHSIDDLIRMIAPSTDMFKLVKSQVEIIKTHMNDLRSRYQQDNVDDTIKTLIYDKLNEYDIIDTEYNKFFIVSAGVMPTLNYNIQHIVITHYSVRLSFDNIYAFMSFYGIALITSQTGTGINLDTSFYNKYLKYVHKNKKIYNLTQKQN